MGVSSLQSLLDRAAARSDPALWHRQAGAWTPGGDGPGRDVRELAAALLHYGVEPGRAVLVLGADGPDTCRASLAVLAAGACLVRLEATVADSVLRLALEGPEVAIAIVEDERQLRRVLALRPDLPNLEMVILLSGEPSERKAAAILVGTAVDLGAGRLEEDPGLLGRAHDGLPPDAPALLVATGDTLGWLSRAELAVAAERLTDEMSFGPGRAVLVALPPGGPESIAIVLGALARGTTVLVTEELVQLAAGLREKPPDGAIVSAAVLRQLHAEWEEETARRSGVARSLTRWALSQGADPARHPRRYRLAEILILSRIRGRYCGGLRGWGLLGAPAGREISEFFAAIGVPIYVMPGVATAPVAR
jgi:long-chain acyl-CoA synthetase